MFEVKTNLLKNRLYLTFGRIAPDKLNEMKNKVFEAVEKLEPGFTCVTRIVDHREFSIADVEHHKSIQEFLKAKGVSKVVRIGVESGKEFLAELSEITGYQAHTANSLEEADLFLNKWVAENL